MLRSRQKYLAVFAAILAGAIWGVSFLAPRVLGGYDPSTISLFRFLFYGFFSGATLITGKLIGRRNLPRITQADCFWGVTLALLGYSFYYFLLSLAIQKSGVAFATLIIGLLPLTILLAAGAFAPVSLFRPKLLALPFAFIIGGVILIYREQKFGGEAGGIVAVAGALMCWTVYSVLNSRFLKLHREWRVMDWSSWVGVYAALTAVLIFFISHGVDSFGALSENLSTRFLLWTAFMGVVGAWGTAGLWNYASRILPAAVVGQLLVAETIFGLIYGFFYEGRLPNIYEGVAIALLLVGAFLGIRAVNRIMGTMDRVVH